MDLFKLIVGMMMVIIYNSLDYCNAKVAYKSVGELRQALQTSKLFELHTPSEIECIEINGNDEICWGCDSKRMHAFGKNSICTCYFKDQENKALGVDKELKSAIEKCLNKLFDKQEL